MYSADAPGSSIVGRSRRGDRRRGRPVGSSGRRATVMRRGHGRCFVASTACRTRSTLCSVGGIHLAANTVSPTAAAAVIARAKEGVGTVSHEREHPNSRSARVRGRRGGASMRHLGAIPAETTQHGPGLRSQTSASLSPSFRYPPGLRGNRMYSMSFLPHR